VFAGAATGHVNRPNEEGQTVCSRSRVSTEMWPTESCCAERESKLGRRFRFYWPTIGAHTEKCGPGLVLLQQNGLGADLHALSSDSFRGEPIKLQVSLIH